MTTNVYARQNLMHPQKHRSPVSRFRRQGLRYATVLLAVLAVALYPGAAWAVYVLSYGNGTANAYGYEPGGDALALNHFNTGGSTMEITAIGVIWTAIAQIDNPTVALYSDPNGDGNPSDMQLIAIRHVNLGLPAGAIEIDNAVQYYTITPTVINGSFFIGAFISDQYNPTDVVPFPTTPLIGIDTSGSGVGQSWMVENSVAGQMNLQYPIATASSWENLSASCSGNHVIQAWYELVVPEPSMTSLLFLGSGILFYARRRLQSKRRSCN